MSDLTRIAVHEGGHVQAAHHVGCPVSSAKASTSGGVVHHAEPPNWQARVLCDLGGLAAEEALLGGASPGPSSEDIRRAEQTCMHYSGHVRAFGKLREQAIANAWLHRDAIIILANALAEHGSLSQNEIATLCWTAASPLSQFQSLYARPVAADEWQTLEVATARKGATVDTAKQVLRGLIVAEEGPFIDGRGEFDEQGLREIANMINAMPEGLRCRWNHPGDYGEQLGTFLGRVKSAKLGVVSRGSRTNKVVRGDLIFNRSASVSPYGNLAAYILAAAEDEDTKSIGASLVIRPREVDQGRGRPPLWYPLELAACDIVTKGAATGSLLAAS